MVIEVSGFGVVTEADVDAHVGGRQRLRVAAANHVDRGLQQGQRSDREHLVGVKRTVMRGHLHRDDSRGRVLVAGRRCQPFGSTSTAYTSIATVLPFTRTSPWGSIAIVSLRPRLV